MARPPKKGLDYFPLDVDCFEDEKIVELNIEFGPLGIMVYLTALTMIYRQGHYLELPLDRAAMHITRRLGCNWTNGVEPVAKILRRCAALDLFDLQLFDQGVITSKGIQKRYFQIASRRRNRNQEYLLLDKDDCADCQITAAETMVIDAETCVADAETVVSVSNNTTNKTTQNKSKVNESRVNKTIPEIPPADGCADLKSAAARAFENAVRPLTGAELLRMDNLCMTYGKYRVLAAVTEAVMRGAKSVGYVETILKSTYDSPPAEHSAPERRVTDQTREIEELMEEGAYSGLE